MKWKNEYIVSVICAQKQWMIAMTIIIGEESNAQSIMNSINKMAVKHLIERLQKPVELNQLNYTFVSLVHTMMITEDEAEKIKIDFE